GKMHFYDLVVEAERETIKSRVFEMAKHGERFAGIEHAVRTKDGRILWNSTSGIPLLNQDGTVRGHQGSDTDITQRRLANLALIESESFNRGLVDNLPEYIIIYGLDGRILYANTASARALGYDPKEAEGTQLLAYVAEESRDTITSMMKARGRGEEVPPYEINVVTRDGQRKSAMVKGSPIQYHDRSAFLVVLNDISDRKLMENTLRSREEKLSLITDHIRENVLLLDMGLKVQWVSPSTVRSRGFTFEELAEMPAEQQLPPESLEKLLLAAERLLTPENLDDPEKEVVFTDVLEFFKKDGDTVWAEVVISLIRDQSGRPSGLLAVGRDVTDHIRSKEALCSSGIGLWEWNVQTGETHFDEYWADIVGYDLAELSPFDIDTWMGMVHTDDLERSKDEIARHFAGEAPSFEVEVRLKCRDGHWTWVLVRGKVLRREADGLPIFTSGTLLDITERKQKEEAQRESEDKFRQLFELGSDALFLIDRGNGQLLELNRAAELMYGYSRTELLQMKSTDLSAQPEETERALKEATTVVPLRFHRKKDGTVFPVEITGTIHEHQGIPVLICAIREITERKRMEEALHESEKRYRLIADNMVEVVVMLDLDLHVIYASPSIEDVFHYTVEEAMYKDVSQIMTPESLQVVMRALEETMAIKTPHANGSRPSLLLELEEYRKDGSTIWVSNSLTFAYDEANEPVAIISVVRDITDRKNIENALNEANRKLNLLNNITRHEITNQVMALTGFLELCKLKEKDPQVLAYLEKMDHATESVKRQIAFTKEYQDIGVKAPAWASPGRQTAEAFALLHPAGMDFEDDSGGVEIFADPLAEKVPYNLIDNSMRHGEHVTRIKLSAEQRGDAVLLLYEDNGVGIVGKDGERLFEKGFGKNTGFGLFLTREILA
ncbi:MAG: PAS domain S-box protein, partial [Methanomassiliicoccales archaeon]